MLTIVVITGLYLLFSSLIYIMLRNKTVPLSWRQSALFLGVKIAAGSLYGYVYGRFYKGDDTWGLNHDVWVQYQRLLHTPGRFFSTLFTLHPVPDADLYFGEFTTRLEYWEFALVTRIMAPFNLISQGNYYINVVFFSFLSFWGAYFLYTLMVTNFSQCSPIPASGNPGSRKPTLSHSQKLTPLISAHSPSFALSISVFLFLPALFWLSGIRAEGLILLFTGLLLYYFSKWIARPRAGNALFCLACFGLLFILRNHFAVLLLPALLAWWLSVRFQIKQVKAFGIIYGVLAVAVVVSSFCPPPFNLLRPVVQAQQSFFALHGNTRFNLTPLEYNTGSFLLVAPEAFVNTLLRPWPWEAKGALQWLVALENGMVWVLIAVCLTRYRGSLSKVFHHPLAWALLCIALSGYLFIGYIVPFPGAIVRYRVLPELFVLCLLATAFSRRDI